MARATIDDVAKRAGVTKSTVSHALSGKRPVSEETRRRIDEAVAELGYRPNPLAQRLATGRSGTVGFAYPIDLESASGAESSVLLAASEVISSAGFAFVLFAQPDPSAAELRRFIESGLLDGVIVAQVQMQDERVRALCAAAASFVMMGRTADNSGLSFVDVDIDGAVEAAVEHLVDLGHQRIAFLHEEAFATAAASRALQAYERACARRRMRLITPACLQSASGGRVATKGLLEHQPEISALVLSSDAMALGAYAAAVDLGRRVPDDLSLVCLAKSQLSALAGVELTYADLRYADQAQLAAAMLLEILGESAAGDRQVLLEPLWSGGESTAPLR
jgi:DNA-binding LacI/PurR family transcriptional regulator